MCRAYFPLAIWLPFANPQPLGRCRGTMKGNSKVGRQSGTGYFQHHAIAFFLQGANRLGSRVVELARLTDDDWA